MERIDKLTFEEPRRSSTREPLESNLFLTQPAEFLVSEVAEFFRGTERWSKFFGESIDDYCRYDYSTRQLPAMRIYIDRWTKQFESWFVEGEMKIDVALTPSLRREELQQYSQTLAGAIMQQMRSPSFFQLIDSAVPGLNELGKTLSSDLTMAFEYQDGVVPLVQVTANFKIDLREWDLYSESDNRTKNEPFARPLGDLRKIATTIEALRSEDADDIELTLGLIQEI